MDSRHADNPEPSAELRSARDDDTPQPQLRARCVYCGKSKPVTGKGNIRRHYVTGGPTTTNAGQRVVCGESGGNYE